MKEQIEALVRDGKLNAALVMFSDYHKIPASEIAGFVHAVSTPLVEALEEARIWVRGEYGESNWRVDQIESALKSWRGGP